MFVYGSKEIRSVGKRENKENEDGNQERTWKTANRAPGIVEAWEEHVK